MLPFTRSIFMATALLAVGIPAHAATAETLTGGAEELPCSGVADVQYELSANLKITDTAMGAGDGVHQVGPGKVVLRFDDRPGHHSVNLQAYEMRQTFTVTSNVLFWSTKVSTNLQMKASRAPSIAEGTRDGRTVRWAGQASGVRSDGTLVCDGSMCGKFGAPPSGTSEIHVGPTSIELKPFQFGADMKTFSMPFALVSESESPKERTLVAMSGREVKRVCAPVEAAP
jgi:hypothetical protein